MRWLLVFAATIASCCGFLNFLKFGGPVKWNSLKVKYTALFDGLYSIPLTVNDIKPGEFTYLEDHKEFPKAKIYCYPDDPRVCPIYDGYGRIAGLRVAYIKKDIKSKVGSGDFPYSYDDKPIFKSGSAFGEDFYYIDALFVSAESLLKDGGPSSRPEAVGDGLYLNIDGKGWKKMPRDEHQLENTLFTRQACFPGMGRHYFYKMNKNLKCDDHQPPFLLYNNWEMIGFGLIPFGAFTSKGSRTWFESPPKAVINFIVPDGPRCLPEYIGKYGGLSIHVYFTQCPRTACTLLSG